MCLFVVYLLAAVGCSEPSPTRGPNLLILSVDTVRADAIGPTAKDKISTPNLDRLYAGGTSFSQAITPMPRTTPALATLLTGLWTWNHASREVGIPMGDVTTLAEVLRREGWQTAAVSANLSASKKQGLHRGFDNFIGAKDLKNIYGGRLLKDLDDIGAENSIGWATATTDQAFRSIEEFSPDQPYFLWLFYFDPHFIYLPPPPFTDVEGTEACWDLYSHFNTRRHLGGQLFTNVGGLASAALDDCLRLYRAEIEYFDSEVGRLMTGLASRGLLDDTVVVFTVDHGENMGEEGAFFEHGSNVHDSAIRVPLVFSGSGIAGGRMDSSSASLVDVTPTVLSLLGIRDTARPSSDGVDLSIRLRAKSPLPEDSDRVVFAESAAPMWNHEVQLLITGRPGHRVCVNDPPYTLCRSTPSKEPNELFDHRIDPGLTNNLFDARPNVVTRLTHVMDRWTVETARQRTARTPRFKLVQRPTINGSFESQLFDLDADPGESVDVKEQFPEVSRRLEGALETWARHKPEIEPTFLDPTTEQSLRELGYLGD